MHNEWAWANDRLCRRYEIVGQFRLGVHSQLSISTWGCQNSKYDMLEIM